MSARLLTSYDATVGALLAEVDRCGAGDRVLVRLYLLEPGASSGAVIEALRRAAVRGARVTITIDDTVGSRLSRIWERTGTLLPEVLALGRELPGRVVAARGRTPDHSKVVVVRRAGGGDAALFGGVNLGDRFRGWRDFAVHLEGPAVARLEGKLAGEPGPDPPPPDGLRFVANVPPAGLFEVRSALEALSGDPAVARLRVAAAYLDRAGAAVLGRALARGASLELLLPRRANVYPEANLRALAELLAAGGRVRARLHPEMIHAKALVAERADGSRVGFVGSANLKRNSFRMFGELSALVSEPWLAGELAVELERLWEEAEEVTAPPRYSRLLAALEERLG